MDFAECWWWNREKECPECDYVIFWKIPVIREPFFWRFAELEFAYTWAWTFQILTHQSQTLHVLSKVLCTPLKLIDDNISAPKTSWATHCIYSPRVHVLSCHLLCWVCRANFLEIIPICYSFLLLLVFLGAAQSVCTIQVSFNFSFNLIESLNT